MQKVRTMVKAVGVEFEQSGSYLQVFATKEAIFSAGSIGSVQLLQLFTINCCSIYWKNAKINLENDLPGVGANLQDHL